MYTYTPSYADPMVIEGSEPKTWTVTTEDIARNSPYHSPLKGWHSHHLGGSLIPTDGCALCAELRRRAAVGEGE